MRAPLVIMLLLCLAIIAMSAVAMVELAREHQMPDMATAAPSALAPSVLYVSQ